MRSGLALSAPVPAALAADTASITVLEIVDNAILLMVPGAMAAGLGSPLFWGVLAFALATRRLIARGQGHAVVHHYRGGRGEQDDDAGRSDDHL